MIYYKLAVLFAVLTIGLANPMQSNVGDGPQRCCLPEQFSSTLTTTVVLRLTDGTDLLTYGFYNFSYDHNRGLFGTRGIVSIPLQLKNINVGYVETVNGAILYTYYPDTQSCAPSLVHPQPLCVPDSAVFYYSSYFGDGSQRFLADTWAFGADGAGIYATFKRDSCFPVMRAVYEANPVRVTTSIITDIVPTIVDPSIFDIPTYCQKVM